MAAASKSVKATVRQLVWVDESEEDFTLYISNTPLGRFSYGTDRSKQAYHQSPLTGRGVDHASEEVARVAAQADYERLVVESIEQHCDVEAGGAIRHRDVACEAICNPEGENEDIRMHDKITIDELRLRSDTPAPIMSEEQKAAQRQLKLAADESSPLGAMVLFTMARLSSRIEGFPGKVKIESVYFGQEGLAVERDDAGVWHFTESVATLSLASSLGDPVRAAMLRRVCRDLEVDETKGKVELDKLIKVPPHRMASMLVDLRDAVPPHAFAGLLSMGNSLEAFSTDGTVPIRSIIDYVVSAGVDIDAPLGEGLRPPLDVAAGSYDDTALKALLDYGASDEVVHDGWRPLEVAIMAGNVEAIGEFVRNGSPLSGYDKPLLHFAIDNFPGAIDRGKQMVMALIEGGVEIGKVNDAGLSASEYLRRTKEAMIIETDFDSDFIDEVIATLEAAERAPSP